MAWPLRYIALRFTPLQRELFESQGVTYHAVVSNRYELDAAELVRRHREKAGTIGARAPRARGRARRRRAAERALRGERGLVPHQHADVRERAQCAQEARAAGALQGRATEAIALRAIHSGRREACRAPEPALATSARQ